MRRHVGLACLIIVGLLAGCIQPDMEVTPTPATEVSDTGEASNTSGTPEPASALGSSGTDSSSDGGTASTPGSLPIAPGDSGTGINATPGAAPVQPAQPAQPAIVREQAPASVWRPTLTSYLESQGIPSASVWVWYDSAFGSGQLMGYSYTDAVGSPCVGVAQAGLVNGAQVVLSNSPVCGNATTTALASSTLIDAGSGDFYTIVFGRVELPTVFQVTVNYSNNTNVGLAPFSGGFLHLVQNPDLSITVLQVTVTDSQNNTVNVPIIPS
ncbi:MAG: hypothetical protein GYB65_20015 [Chloroflexi bacterium]|nr:hypothetical protein [Chloroflexota bacterium]